ncbi:MAG: YggS family pyridoxal phosphate-dependent enzyme [Gemmataceae bacterium]
MSQTFDGSLVDFFSDRLKFLEDQIQDACVRSGRNREDVQLVAVTKYVEPQVAAQLHAAGATDLGESRPQELWRKTKAVPHTARWHMIGHLQTNKIDKTLPLVDLIHSGDRLKLLRTLDKEASKQDTSVDVLLEVNVSREEAKHGFAPEELEDVAAKLSSLERVRVRGMMTMAAYDEDPENCRPTFVELRELRDRLQNQMPTPHTLEHLSMGMSNDFVVAIEEGATMIRVGSVLYEGMPGKTT